MFFASYSILGQKKLPSSTIKTLQGKPINIQDINNDGNPIVISFWATWCKPCKKELNAIAEVYEDWQDETDVKLIAISIDDSRSKSKVKPMVNANGWEYEILLDPKKNLSNLLGVGTIPHTFLINGKGEIVWEHTNYLDGDEELLYEKILSISKQ
tara:strand:- start:19811 stop:20275 length:465 start_codon:yes stop_codon:yes gene_type:complete